MKEVRENITAGRNRDHLQDVIVLLAKYESNSRSEMSRLRPEMLYEYLLNLIVEIQNLPALFERLGQHNTFGVDGVLNDNDVPVIALKFPNNNIRHFMKAIGNNPDQLKRSIQSYVENSAKCLTESMPVLETSS